MTRLQKSYEIASFKALPDEGEGTFEAIVSVFGNVDLQGDRVMPKAFDKSIAKLKQAGDPLPVIWSHDWGDPFAHIGYVDPKDLKEVSGSGRIPGGLLVKGHLDIHKPFAKQVYDLLRERRVKEFSFSYDIPIGGERRGKDGANELVEVDLIEVGPTLKGANPATVSLGTKSSDEIMAVKARLDRAAGKERGDASNLIRWFNEGADGAIAWGTPGDWAQCVAIASQHMDPEDAKGFCQNRHIEATGMTTSEHAHNEGKQFTDDELMLMLAKAGWNGDAAMRSCKSAADFRKIAFERDNDSDPDTAAHWALPHHPSPGAEADPGGVSAALGALNGARGGAPDLKNEEAARKHLEAHQGTKHLPGEHDQSDHGRRGGGERAPYTTDDWVASGGQVDAQGNPIATPLKPGQYDPTGEGEEILRDLSQRVSPEEAAQAVRTPPNEVKVGDRIIAPGERAAVVTGVSGTGLQGDQAVTIIQFQFEKPRDLGHGLIRASEGGSMMINNEVDESSQVRVLPPKKPKSVDLSKAGRAIGSRVAARLRERIMEAIDEVLEEVNGNGNGLEENDLEEIEEEKTYTAGYADAAAGRRKSDSSDGYLSGYEAGLADRRKTEYREITQLEEQLASLEIRK